MRYRDVRYWRVWRTILLACLSWRSGHWPLTLGAVRQSPSSHGQCQNCIIRDISTDCASQWDTSCLSARAAARGKWWLRVCIQQGLVSQRSESELWLPPLWVHKLARSCTCKRMRTRNKTRLDAIAGNLKLFMRAGSWIKNIRTKKIEKQLWKHVRAVAASHYWEGMTCFAFHWIWWLFSEWFLIFRISLPIQLCFGHHNLLHRPIRNFRQHNHLDVSPGNNVGALLDFCPLWFDFYLSFFRFFNQFFMLLHISPFTWV